MFRKSSKTKSKVVCFSAYNLFDFTIPISEMDRKTRIYYEIEQKLGLEIIDYNNKTLLIRFKSGNMLPVQNNVITRGTFIPENYDFSLINIDSDYEKLSVNAKLYYVTTIMNNLEVIEYGRHLQSQCKIKMKDGSIQTFRKRTIIENKSLEYKQRPKGDDRKYEKLFKETFKYKIERGGFESFMGNTSFPVYFARNKTIKLIYNSERAELDFKLKDSPFYFEINEKTHYLLYRKMKCKMHNKDVYVLSEEYHKLKFIRCERNDKFLFYIWYREFEKDIERYFNTYIYPIIDFHNKTNDIQRTLNLFKHTISFTGKDLIEKKRIMKSILRYLNKRGSNEPQKS